MAERLEQIDRRDCALRDQSVIPAFINVFLKNSQSSDIKESVSVLHGAQFVSYRIGNDVYHVGSLSWWVRFNLYASAYPAVVVVCIAGFCILMAVLIRALLRKRARVRLQGND